jgi:hypothetical protein
MLDKWRRPSIGEMEASARVSPRVGQGVRDPRLAPLGAQARGAGRQRPDGAVLVGLEGLSELLGRTAGVEGERLVAELGGG